MTIGERGSKEDDNKGDGLGLGGIDGKKVKSLSLGELEEVEWDEG